MDYREYVYDFRTAQGKKMRAVVLGTMVKFYDREYEFNMHGQFTGASYYTDTLLKSSANKGGPKGGRPGKFVLHGGVPDWDVDGPNWKLFLDWLAKVTEEK